MYTYLDQLNFWPKEKLTLVSKILKCFIYTLIQVISINISSLLMLSRLILCSSGLEPISNILPVSYFVDFVVWFLLMFHLRKHLFLCQSVPCISACISSTQAFIDVVCCVTFIGESSSLSGLFSQSCRVVYQDTEEWKNRIYAQFAFCICVK